MPLLNRGVEFSKLFWKSFISKDFIKEWGKIDRDVLKSKHRSRHKNKITKLQFSKPNLAISGCKKAQAFL